ncbi:MAG TPA: hypothetical protein VIM29_09365 [Bacillota bacterium]
MIDFFCKNLWRWKCGLPEIELDTNPYRLTLDQIKQRNCNHPEFATFDKMADNRMIMGFYRYGEVGKQGMIRRAEYLKMKAEEYLKTGNMECLLDLRNVARVEWVEKSHPNAHFKSIDDKNHGERG